MRKETVNINGKDIEVVKINNDINGNPRCVVHYMDIGIALNDYEKVNKLYGFKRYRGKEVTGGIVFQSHSIKDRLQYMIDEVKRVKKNKRNKVLKPLIVEARKASKRINEESDISKANKLYLKRTMINNEINRIKKEYAI